MRKPAAKSFAGWRSITACTNASPRRQRSADGSSRASPFPPRRSGVRSGNCTATGLCSYGLSLRTYTRSMWKVMSICSERGTESFFSLLRNERAASFPYHGIRIIHSFRGYQGFPRGRDQRHSGSFHHVSPRFRKPSRRFLFVRGNGRPGRRFSVARSAGFGKLHRNVRFPAALAPGRTGIRRNTPVRHHDATTVDEWSENNNDNS